MSILALTLALALQSPEAEASAVVDAMHQAASRADGDAYFATFTPQARFVGTDASEHWPLEAFRAYADPIFSQGRGWTYRPVERSLTIAPIECRCVAWFDERLAHDSYGDLRGSGVLRRTEDGWRIEQYVLSFTVPNDQADAVVELIQAAE